MATKIDKILSRTYIYLQSNGYAPSIRNICSLVGIASTSEVANYLDKLEEAGLLTRIKGISRSIVITPAGETKAQQLIAQEKTQ